MSQLDKTFIEICPKPLDVHYLNGHNRYRNENKGTKQMIITSTELKEVATKEELTAVLFIANLVKQSEVSVQTKGSVGRSVQIAMFSKHDKLISLAKKLELPYGQNLAITWEGEQGTENTLNIFTNWLNLGLSKVTATLTLVRK